MTWLTPLTGVLLAAAIVPPLVALYFLKLRRTPRPIGSTLLWKRALEDMRANAPFQRLRMNLLLLLQLLIVGLLALALAQPQVDAGLRRGGKTVLLIDNSASMNATDVSEDGAKPSTRLDQAKERAIAKVERLFSGGLFSGGSGEVMVVAFADRPDVRCPFTDDRGQVLDAIRSIKPTDGRTRIGDAFSLARAFVLSAVPEDFDPSKIEPADLVVFSDGRIEDLATQARKPGEVIVYERVGNDDADNAGIVAIAAERSPENPDRIQVFAAVANAGVDPASCDVQLSVDGVVRAVTPEPIKVPAATDGKDGSIVSGREQVVFLPFAQPRDAVIEVAQLRKDDLPVDDAAAVVIPPAKRLRVALVGDSFVIRSLLEGMALEALTVLSSAEFEALLDGGDATGGVDGFDVVVLSAYTPREGKPLPPGRYLSFAGVPVPELQPYGTHERVVVRQSRDEHPVFRYVPLDDVVISQMQALSPTRDVEVLVEGSDGPIVLALDRAGVRLVHVAFDPLDSNWPILRSFVNFVANAVEWLGASGDALASSGLAPGETASLRIPNAASDVRVRLPDGTEEPVALREPGQLVFGPVRRVGIYTASWTEPGREGRQERRFAANLLSAAEGQIRPDPELRLGGDAITGRVGSANARSAAWPLLLVLALGILLVEWWVYQRRTL